jgi:hypothetical protein
MTEDVADKSSASVGEPKKRNGPMNGYAEFDEKLKSVGDVRAAITAVAIRCFFI